MPGASYEVQLELDATLPGFGRMRLRWRMRVACARAGRDPDVLSADGPGAPTFAAAVAHHPAIDHPADPRGRLARVAFGRLTFLWRKVPQETPASLRPRPAPGRIADEPLFARRRAMMAALGGPTPWWRL